MTDGFTDLGNVPAGLDPREPGRPTGGVRVGRFTGAPYDGIQLAIYPRGPIRPAARSRKAYLTPAAARRLAAKLTGAAGDPEQAADLLAIAELLVVARAVAAWLDANNGRSRAEISLRLLKLAEEVGEVAQAWIGALGQNPRKGRHPHSRRRGRRVGRRDRHRAGGHRQPRPGPRRRARPQGRHDRRAARPVGVRPVSAGLMALTLPGLAVPTWQVRAKADPAACALADRHYSRQRPGCGQVGPPGRLLVLVTPCERAVWVTHWPYPQVALDRLDAWRCSLFRNEAPGELLSSDLIQAAMALTASLWPGRPAAGWLTWIDRTKVRSPNPGYCFKQAGWTLDRSWPHPRLIRLRAAVAGEPTP